MLTRCTRRWSAAPDRRSVTGGADPSEGRGREVHGLVRHRYSSTGKRAIADTVIPATPATTPSNARSEAGSSSAMPDRDVARAPHTTALTPRTNPSPNTQNDAMDNAPRANDTEGNRDPPRGDRGRPRAAELASPVTPDWRGVAAVRFLLQCVGGLPGRRCHGIGCANRSRATLQSLLRRGQQLLRCTWTSDCVGPAVSRWPASSTTENLALSLVEC